MPYAKQESAPPRWNERDLLLIAAPPVLAVLLAIAAFFFIRGNVICFGMSCLHGHVSSASDIRSVYSLPGKYCFVTGETLFPGDHRGGRLADAIMQAVYLVYPSRYLFIAPAVPSREPIIAIQASHLADRGSRDVEFCGSGVRAIRDSAGLKLEPAAGN